MNKYILCHIEMRFAKERNQKNVFPMLMGITVRY